MGRHDLVFGFFPARGRGRGRSRNEDEEEGAGGRPSGPSTLFDFLESKMGVFSIDGGCSGPGFILNCLLLVHKHHLLTPLLDMFKERIHPE